MKIFKAYLTGLRSALHSKKMVTVIYTVTLLLALILAIPFHTAIQNQAGNTMALHSLLKHFNYTIFSEFMRSSGKIVNSFLAEAVWMGIFYFLFTVFFSGGILNELYGNAKKFSIAKFLTGCGKYFFKFLRLGVYILIIQFVLALIIFLPLGKILSGNYDTTQNEASLFYIFITGIIIFSAIFMLILIIGDYSKIIIFNSDSGKVIRAIGKSFKFVFRHIFGSYTLYLLILFISVIFLVMYFLLDNAIGMVSGITIFIMFLIQQAFVWLRIFMKIWFLGSEISFYKNFTEPTVRAVPAEISQYSLPGNNSDDVLENPQPV